MHARRLAQWLGMGRAAGVLLAVPLAIVACRQPSGQLPDVKASIDQTSVSGISSGAYMAGQFQLAHSRTVVGAAIIAGGPFGCAESIYADLMPGPGTTFLNLSKAINGCMLNALTLWGIPNPRLLAERAQQLAREGRIDPIDGVARDRVYLFAGREDHTVVPAIVAAAADFYRRIGVGDAQIQHVTTVAAGHAFVTESKGGACGRSAAPYVEACRYDQAGELLRHIYGPLKPKSATARGTYQVFDQREFTRNLGAHGLEDTGVAYIPEACRRSAGCRVHIAFHGCAQNRTAVGDAFITDSGFAAWADENSLIVLYPQAAAAAMNPQGCWDWWGYTGRDFLTRKAPQIVAVQRMLERLAGRAAVGSIGGVMRRTATQSPMGMASAGE